MSKDNPSLLVDKVKKYHNLSSKQLASVFDVEESLIDKWSVGDSIPPVYTKELESMLPPDEKKPHHGPVTLVYSFTGFFHKENKKDIFTALYDSNSDALTASFWLFHENTDLDAFIINASGVVSHSVDDLKKTLKLAARSVFGVQAVDNNGRVIPSREIDKDICSGRTVPTLPEAISIAKEIIKVGYDVKIGLPNGNTLNTKDIENK